MSDSEMMSDVDEPKAAPVQDGLDEQLVGQLIEQAKPGGLQLTGEGGGASAADQAAAGVGARGRDGRSPRLRQTRRPRPQRRQLPQRHPFQDGAHRRRLGRDRRAA